MLRYLCLKGFLSISFSPFHTDYPLEKTLWALRSLDAARSASLSHATLSLFFKDWAMRGEWIEKRKIRVLFHCFYVFVAVPFLSYVCAGFCHLPHFSYPFLSLLFSVKDLFKKSSLKPFLWQHCSKDSHTPSILLESRRHKCALFLFPNSHPIILFGGSLTLYLDYSSLSGFDKPKMKATLIEITTRENLLRAQAQCSRHISAIYFPFSIRTQVEKRYVLWDKCETLNMSSLFCN